MLEIHPLPRRVRKDDLQSQDDSEQDERAKTYLEGLPPRRKRAILVEARCKRARLLSTPWYAEPERKGGNVFWLQLSISDARED